MNLRFPLVVLTLVVLAMMGGAVFGLARGRTTNQGHAAPTTIAATTAPVKPVTTKSEPAPTATTPTTKPTTTDAPATTAAKSAASATTATTSAVKPGEGPLDPEGVREIKTAHAEYGGDGGQLGPAESEIYCGLKNGGCGQRYKNGTMFWSRATSAWPSQGPVLARYAELKWENSFLGYPTSDTYCDLPNNGCGQRFENGTMFFSPATGARIVKKGKLLDYYRDAGYERGSLGFPVADEAKTTRNGQSGVEQRFQKGTLFYAGSGAVQRT